VSLTINRYLIYPPSRAYALATYNIALSNGPHHYAWDLIFGNPYISEVVRVIINDVQPACS
jgi:hypothetical protein